MSFLLHHRISAIPITKRGEDDDPQQTGLYLRPGAPNASKYSPDPILSPLRKLFVFECPLIMSGKYLT